jgi:hypothetical protein
VKRTKALRLVLLGGGVATMLAACGNDEARARECALAKAQQRPDAEQICRRSTSSSTSSSSSSGRYYGGPWFAGRTSGTPSGTAASSSSSRGGFGSTGSSSGS